MTRQSSGHALLRLFRAKIRHQRRFQLMLMAKAVTFQFFSVAMTFLLSFMLTHDINISLSISTFEVIFKVVLYYIFDVSWSRLFNHF